MPSIMPSRYLLIATVLVIGAVNIIPYTLLGKEFGFVSLPFSILGIIVSIIGIYITGIEVVKRLFYKRIKF